jgi:hypothetical protein
VSASLDEVTPMLLFRIQLTILEDTTLSAGPRPGSAIAVLLCCPLNLGVTSKPLRFPVRSRLWGMYVVLRHQHGAAAIADDPVARLQTSAAVGGGAPCVVHIHLEGA